MISSKGLMLLMPRRIIMPPAMRSKIRESRMNTPTREMNRPRTKKTMAMPKVKAIPIMNPSLEVEALFSRYSSFLRMVRT